MTRIERLKEIEKLWKKRNRIEPWENLKWETDVSQDKKINAETVHQAEMKLKYIGHIIDILDGSEIEVSETPWDDYLLYYLRVWYYLSEDCDAPLFVHEEAYAVAIAAFDPERFDLLFYHPVAVALGMENWEKRIRECHAEIHELKKASRRGKYKTPEVKAMRFLNTPVEEI